jgi:hypothetical protein
VVVSRPFEQWGLDIIGEITPSSSKQHRYILTATYYFTKWAEAIPLTHVNEKVVIQFIEQQLITRFGVFFITPYISSYLEFSLYNHILCKQNSASQV